MKQAGRQSCRAPRRIAGVPAALSYRGAEASPAYSPGWRSQACAARGPQTGSCARSCGQEAGEGGSGGTGEQPGLSWLLHADNLHTQTACSSLLGRGASC